MNNGIFSKIDFAILLTCITSLTYFLGFLYNEGKLAYYNIPFSFVELGIKENITTLLHIIPLIGPIIWFTIYEYKKNNNIKRKEQEILKEAILDENFEMSDTKLNEINNRIKGLWKTTRKEMITVVFILILSIVCIFYLTRFYGVTIYFSIGITAITALICNFVFSRWYSQGKTITLLAAAFILLITITFMNGLLDQLNNKVYTIVNYKKETYVNLVMYNNQFIIAPLTRDKHHYQNKFKIIDPKDVDTFWSENLGYLSVQKNK